METLVPSEMEPLLTFWEESEISRDLLINKMQEILFEILVPVYVGEEL